MESVTCGHFCLAAAQIMHTMARKHYPGSITLPRVSVYLTMSYPKIIAAISDELRLRYEISGQPLAQPDEIAGRILASQTAMPDFLRLPMRALTWTFDFWGLIASGVRFRNMPAELRSQQLDSWKASRFDVCRSFVRFYESLFLLIVLDEDAR